LGAKEIWKTSTPPKVKFFFWLVLHKRCWTAARRKKHGLQDDDSSSLCDQEPETLDHLLTQCVFSKVWTHVLSKVGLLNLLNQHDVQFVIWWLGSRKMMPKQARKGFDSIVTLIGWSIWKERNARTFRRMSDASYAAGPVHL
jgi:hypothetical protein